MNTNIDIAFGAVSHVQGDTGIGVGSKVLSFVSKEAWTAGRQMINTVSVAAEHESKGESILEECIHTPTLVA